MMRRFTQPWCCTNYAGSPRICRKGAARRGRNRQGPGVRFEPLSMRPYKISAVYFAHSGFQSRKSSGHRMPKAMPNANHELTMPAVAREVGRLESNAPLFVVQWIETDLWNVRLGEVQRIIRYRRDQQTFAPWDIMTTEGRHVWSAFSFGSALRWIQRACLGAASSEVPCVVERSHTFRGGEGVTL